MSQSKGRVESLATRPTDGEPMQVVDRLDLRAGAGATSEANRTRNRGLTLISAEAWRDTCRELGNELPWFARRANVLVSGLDLASLIGRVLDIGPVRVHIHGETKPCGLMDKIYPGLKDALKPACRGGVFGEVLVDGSIDVGSVISVSAAESC